MMKKFSRTSFLIDPDPTDEPTNERYPAELTHHLLQIKEQFIEQIYDPEKELSDEDKVEKWNERVSQHLGDRNLQHFFTTILSKTAKNEIHTELNKPGTEADYARFLSVAKSHTGDFLLALPKSKALTLNALEFSSAVRIRLGCDFINMPNGKCSCKRNPILDKKGVHLLSCPKGGHLIYNHDAVQRDIQVLATSAGFQASALSKDVILRNNTPAINNRKGDLLIPAAASLVLPADEDKGFPLLLDFTRVNGASKSAFKNTIKDSDSSLMNADDKKYKKYKPLAEANDIEFMPMAFECYGALSKKFQKLVRALCHIRAEAQEIEEEAVLNYWYRRISCTIQRGNSIAISKRIIDIVQTTTPLQDEYYRDNIIDLEHNNIDTMLRSSVV